jgi:hypothetical protein
MTERPDQPYGTPGRIFRAIVQLSALVLVVWALHSFIDRTLTQMSLRDDGDMIMIGVLVLLVLAYAFMIAIPFVPGIEIGMSLLALRGLEIAPFLYLATVSGLMLAYGMGQWLSHDWLAARCRDLRLSRIADMLEQARDLSPKERLAQLEARLPAGLARHAIRWRYLLLALLVNLPGSGVIGGGGGISLMAGVSRMYRPWPTLLTFALAVAPVPLLVWSLGYDPTGP